MLSAALQIRAASPGWACQAALAIPTAATKTFVASPATALASSALPNATSASSGRPPAKCVVPIELQHVGGVDLRSDAFVDLEGKPRVLAGSREVPVTEFDLGSVHLGHCNSDRVARVFEKPQGVFEKRSSQVELVDHHEGDSERVLRLGQPGRVTA